MQKMHPFAVKFDVGDLFLMLVDVAHGCFEPHRGSLVVILFALMYMIFPLDARLDR